MGRRERIGDALQAIAPRVPRHEREAILDHAMDSAGLASARPEAAAWLSAVAYIRHTLTDYDELLADGYDADSARFFVLNDINGVLEQWGATRHVSGTEPDSEPE